MNIKSDPANLKKVRSYIEKSAQEAGFSQLDTHNIVLAVDEACTNIMRHSYKGDKSREISISIDSVPDKITIILRDFGIKPDMEKIKHKPKNKIRQGGYGTILIKKIMDEVRYDTSPEKGTILTLVKYKNN